MEFYIFMILISLFCVFFAFLICFFVYYFKIKLFSRIFLNEKDLYNKKNNLLLILYYFFVIFILDENCMFILLNLEFPIIDIVRTFRFT